MIKPVYAICEQQRRIRAVWSARPSFNHGKGAVLVLLFEEERTYLLRQSEQSKHHGRSFFSVLTQEHMSDPPDLWSSITPSVHQSSPSGNLSLTVPKRCFCCSLFLLSIFVRFLFVFDLLFNLFRIATINHNRSIALERSVIDYWGG